MGKAVTGVLDAAVAIATNATEAAIEIWPTWAYALFVLGGGAILHGVGGLLPVSGLLLLPTLPAVGLWRVGCFFCLSNLKV